MKSEVQKLLEKEITYHLERVKMLIFRAMMDDGISGYFGYRSIVPMPTRFPSGKDALEIRFDTREMRGHEMYLDEFDSKGSFKQ